LEGHFPEVRQPEVEVPGGHFVELLSAALHRSDGRRKVVLYLRRR